MIFILQSDRSEDKNKEEEEKLDKRWKRENFCSTASENVSQE